MKWKFLTLAAVMAVGSAASASTFDQIYVFGDSLSDNGNAALALGSNPLAPLPPNYNGVSYTDGPNTTPATSGPFGLWIDQFAPKIGVADPQPYLAGGTNYAVASAETGNSSLQDMGNQVLAYLGANPVADPNALYVVFGGSNDLFNADPSSDPSAVAGAAVTNLVTEIGALASTGAKHFLWFNAPALQDTPSGAAEMAFLQAASQDFRNDWLGALANFQAGGININGVDLYTLMQTIVANPGFYNLNVTTPAQGISGVDPNQYLFWDDEHPTTAGDALIADAAAAALPEPGLVGAMGLALIVITRRRRFSSKF